MSSGEHITLPSGESLWYYDEDHSYWRHNPTTGKRGRRLSGVTTVCKAMDLDPKNLLRWAARMQCHGFAARMKMGAGSWLDSGESVWEELVNHNLTYEDVRDAAATVGTNVHEVAFQALGMGRPVPDLDRLTEVERGHSEAIMAFWLDHEPVAEQVEQIVYSERLGVAGRLDYRGALNSRDGIGVIDCKTGNYISAAAHVQVGGGYPLLAEESGYGPSDWALVLKTYEDGHYELIEAQGTPEDFEAAVTVYRAAGRINGAAMKARKAAQLQEAA